jgi:hypothetical protein
MKTLNLTKISPVSLGSFITYRNTPNSELPIEIEQKFIKDNYIIGKGELVLSQKENNQYFGEITNQRVILEYKEQNNVLCVIYFKSNKQNLYVIKTA